MKHFHEPGSRSGVSAERRHNSEDEFAALCRDAATPVEAATVLNIPRLLGWLRALWFTRSRWQRYRVTPRTNPASFRRELLRSIHGELRRSGLNPPRASRGTNL